MKSWLVKGYRTVLLLCAAPTLLTMGVASAAAQDDRGIDVEQDGGGQEVLQSIFIPPIAHAPFSLILATEWARPINDGGTFTIVNTRPIKRDSEGRIYQERWLLAPKGSDIPSTMSWIQIADPVAHTLLECSVRQHLCELEDWNGSRNVRYEPSRFQSGPLPDGKGQRTHEDLGAETVAGLPVHAYRDTTTLAAGVLGNDRPMSTIREFRYSSELGINLISILETARLGRQTFTVTEISTTEPDPSFFQAPTGYRVVNHRTTKPPAN
jgi:hypothetical protein